MYNINVFMFGGAVTTAVGVRVCVGAGRVGWLCGSRRGYVLWGYVGCRGYVL